MRVIRQLALVGVVFILTAASAYAQAVITGVVTDSSGAVLPGVTVEASSPALIEKVRTVVTDTAASTGSSTYAPARIRSRFRCRDFAR